RSRRSANRPSPEAEVNGVVPGLRGLVGRLTLPISLDTTKAEVARQALEAGAISVNDVTAGLGGPEMIGVVRYAGAAVVLMHMQGTPETMQQNPTYADVVREVRDFLADRVHAWVAAG